MRLMVWKDLQTLQGSPSGLTGAKLLSMPHLVLEESLTTDENLVVFHCLGHMQKFNTYQVTKLALEKE